MQKSTQESTQLNLFTFSTLAILFISYVKNVDYIP